MDDMTRIARARLKFATVIMQALQGGKVRAFKPAPDDSIEETVFIPIDDLAYHRKHPRAVDVTAQLLADWPRELEELKQEAGL